MTRRLNKDEGIVLQGVRGREYGCQDNRKAHATEKEIDKAIAKNEEDRIEGD